MPTVQLSDIIDVTVYRDLPAVNSPENTAFAQSGVVVQNPLLNELANSAGKTAELPFWQDLDYSGEPNYSSDDPASNATPDKAQQGEQIARKAFVNNGWQAADLVNELATGEDALQHIRNRADAYFMKQWQKRLVSSAKGVLADNVANDSGDMVLDLASESVAGQSASTLFSDDGFIEASYTMGDAVEQLGAIAVHSNVMKQMVKQGSVEDVRDADGQLLFRTYKGMRIIMSDLALAPVAGSTDGFKYLSIIFGGGAFAFGNGTPTVPVAVEREESAADGGGVEALWVRNTWLIHPLGFQNTGTPAGNSFTLAELESAATWDRVVDRKNIPMSFLWTN